MNMRDYPTLHLDKIKERNFDFIVVLHFTVTLQSSAIDFLMFVLSVADDNRSC